jgi:regulator of sigma E protease
VNLAILNVLPIPVLDGGHLMFIAIEAVRRKPLSERSMVTFQYAGFLLLMVLMAFVIVQDIGRLLG